MNLRKHASDLLDNLVFASLLILEVERRGPVRRQILRDTTRGAAALEKIRRVGGFGESCSPELDGSFDASSASHSWRCTRSGCAVWWRAWRHRCQEQDKRAIHYNIVLTTRSVNGVYVVRNTAWVDDGVHSRESDAARAFHTPEGVGACNEARRQGER